MRSFKLKGGILYSAFKNPHYSYREIVFKKILEGKSDPEQVVSGELLVFMLGRVFSIIEQDDAPEQP
jgi:hypothetical protein